MKEGVGGRRWGHVHPFCGRVFAKFYAGVLLPSWLGADDTRRLSWYNVPATALTMSNQGREGGSSMTLKTLLIELGISVLGSLLASLILAALAR